MGEDRIGRNLLATVAIPVLAALLGAVAGGLMTQRVARQQLQHEDRTRFNEVRYQAYREFLDAVADLQVAIEVLNRDPPHSTRDQAANDRFSTAIDRLSSVTESFQFFSTRSVHTSSTRVLSAARDLQRTLQEHPGDSSRLDGARQELAKRRFSFVLEVRRELRLDDL